MKYVPEFGLNSEGKRPHKGSMNRGGNNIKIYLNKTWRDDIDSIKLIEDKGQWRAVVSTVMCFQIA
jgi:hypothetical protein